MENPRVTELGVAETETADALDDDEAETAAAAAAAAAATVGTDSIRDANKDDDDGRLCGLPICRTSDLTIDTALRRPRLLK